MKKKIGLLAGGSGIAPCLQILKEVFEKRPEDKTEVSLLFGAPDLSELVYREEIQEIVKQDPLLKVKFMVDKVLPGTFPSFVVNFLKKNLISSPKKDQTLPNGIGVGFITKDLMAQQLPKPEEDCLIILCGVCLFFFNVI